MSIERIKFRGKESSVGTWCYSGSLPSGLAEFWKWVSAGQIDPNTVGQWTGLVDSKGVEIWEGDRMKLFPTGEVGVIEFIPANACFKIVWNAEDKKKRAGFPLFFAMGMSEKSEPVVIGNVYEVTT